MRKLTPQVIRALVAYGWVSSAKAPREELEYAADCMRNSRFLATGRAHLRRQLEQAKENGGVVRLKAPCVVFLDAENDHYRVEAFHAQGIKLPSKMVSYRRLWMPAHVRRVDFKTRGGVELSLTWDVANYPVLKNTETGKVQHHPESPLMWGLNADPV